MRRFEHRDNRVDAPPGFERYIGIDYSGAEAPLSRLDGLRVYVATRNSEPLEEAGSGRRWSRQALAEWLVRALSEESPVIVGIDHAFSFPLNYFARHGIQHNWPAFLDDFQRHWPTDRHTVWVRDLRNEPDGPAANRRGETTWRRLTEKRAGSAKSVFHFGVQGEVATSTHAGLPWLRRVRYELGDRVHFWPFDGWQIPSGKSAIVEVYPRLWRAEFPIEVGNGHQQDAYAVSAWLREADLGGSLQDALVPQLSETERKTAEVEGWILGVGVM